MPIGAAVGVAAVGAGGSILGASAQKKAAKKAANAQIQNTETNNALARENRNILTGYINPYNQVGLNANNTLSGVTAAGPYNGGSINSKFVQMMDPGGFGDYRKSTGYDFRMNEGLDAVGTNFAHVGAFQSGAAMKGLNRFAQGLASDEYQNYRQNLGQYTTYADQFANQERGYKTDQFNNWVNLLGNQQQVGLGAVNALSGVNTNMTNSIMGNNSQAAAAQSNAALATGAANSQMYAGIANALGQAGGMFISPNMGMR